jgi:hypothetical protein
MWFYLSFVPLLLLFMNVRPKPPDTHESGKISAEPSHFLHRAGSSGHDNDAIKLSVSKIGEPYRKLVKSRKANSKAVAKEEE